MGNYSFIQLADYEQQKRLGHVYTQRPAEFNPARYVSVRTFENVILNAPIPETEFLSRVKKVWFDSHYYPNHHLIICNTIIYHF